MVDGLRRSAKSLEGRDERDVTIRMNCEEKSGRELVYMY